MSESLLDKYPHLRLLTKLRKPPVLPLPDDKINEKNVEGKENPNTSSPPSGRISLLGPGVGQRTPLGPISSTIEPVHIPRIKVVADDLFAASIAADDDEWLQFQVDGSVPARQQLDQLKMWLMSNSPSTVRRSSGVGWIAVKFRDKGKKVLEAKDAWDAFEGEKTMEVVNNLADEFNVKGGKWLCHLPTGLIDQVWGKLATTLLCGGLGPSVYMVKVSPMQDINPEQSRGEHVICVYNTDYKDTEQVMRVETLLRSAGVTTNLTYKPDIFSALGIYRNNKWGFRPTIYHSRVMVMEGRSKVEVVGTKKWYYNSSKGLQHPPTSERKEMIVERKQGDFASQDIRLRKNDNKGKNEEHVLEEGVKTKVDVDMPEEEGNAVKNKGIKDLNKEINTFTMENIDDLKYAKKEKEVSSPMKGDVSHEDGSKYLAQQKSKLDTDQSMLIPIFNMKEMEAMKKSDFHEQDGPTVNSNTHISLRAFGREGVQGGVDESQNIDGKSFSRDNEPEERSSSKEIVKETVINDQKVSPDEKMSEDDVLQDEQACSSKKPEKGKPAWLLKLQQLQLRSLDELSKTD